MAGLPPHSQTDEPFPIFEDDFFTQPAPMISNAPMPSQPTPARPPLQNQSPNALLCPPTTTAAPLKQSSPFKSNALPQSSPLGTLNNASQKSRLNMVPMVPPAMAPPAAAPQSTDSLEKKQPVMSRFKTVAKKPQPDTGMQFLPKETLAQLPAYPAPAQSQFDLDLGNFYRNDSGKRVLMEAAPIKELRPSKKQRTEDPLPAHDSFPPIADDGQKPNHSYATLIAMAIVRSPHRRLTLSQIYKWISDTYSYYRGDSTGWQNSIRHNLSLNKSFVKQERPKDDPGKGSYWSIEPGTEHTVLKEKPSRKAAAPTAENMPVMSTRLEPSQPQPQQPQPQQQQLLQQQPLQQPPLQQPPQQQQRLQQPPQQQQPPNQQFLQVQQQQAQLQRQQAQLRQAQLQPSQLPCIPDHMVSAHLAMPQSVLPALPPSSSQQPQQNLAPAPPLMSMISSDATIPASDAATIEDLEPQMYSPLPAAMHSSPPIPRRMESIHNGTPPPSYRQMLHLSSATQSRPRRRFMSMDDSGYISSLESSAMRPHQNSKLLTSEADRPRIKKGRAEEEIARIRGSSYDSPSKGRSYGYPPPSSSPLRQSDSGSGQMLPPLTPASKFQAPPKPPPSVSPSTNLRLHRENIQSMVDSPFRRVSALMPEGGDSLQQQTPRMNSESLWYFFDDQGLPGSNSNTPGFDIHEDAVDFHAMFSTTPTTATNVTHLGSPAKRPSSRKQRAQSTNALGLVPESATNNAQRQSFLRVPNQNNSLGLDTPSKAFEGLPSSPSKAFEGLPPSPTKMPNTNDENLFQEVSLDGLAGGSFDDGDFAGLDMLAGFQRIGGGGQQQQQQQQLGGQGSYGRSPNGGPF